MKNCKTFGVNTKAYIKFKETSNWLPTLQAALATDHTNTIPEWVVAKTSG